ncbi:sugar transferase [Novosphingobium sp.]|uniref:sugar transferase n=1 Tax=Novosphingobium sp. TaxID=1874826 RepID=UPI0038BC7683
MNELVSMSAFTPALTWPDGAAHSSAPSTASPRVPVVRPVRPGGSSVRTVTATERAIRALDLTIAAGLLILSLPLLVLIGFVIQVTSSGPIVFAHRRIGEGGRAFPCFKFRTMVTDADARLQALLQSDPVARDEWARTQKLRNDPRVTMVGLLLRRSSLDELPQLINILRGDMSLVGPRPIVEAEIPRYGRHFAQYCSVKPGVTGLWQVQRNADTSYRRRVAFDVAYTRSRSFWLNLKILALTLPSVLRGKGAC